MSDSKITQTHRMDSVTAVWCEDGSAGLCGIVTAIMPEGVSLVGNGTCPRPLGVRLTGAQAVAHELAKCLEECVDRLERLDALLLQEVGAKRDGNLGEVSRARVLLDRMCKEVKEPESEVVGRIKALNTWNAANSQDARSHGWDMVEEADGALRIHRVDVGLISTDADAVFHVADRAAGGDVLARKAKRLHGMKPADFGVRS